MASTHASFPSRDGIAADRRKAAQVPPGAFEVGGFAAGTEVLTARGTIPVEWLRRDDLVLTRDNGLKPVVWIGARKLDAQTLAAAPQCRPVRVAA